MKVECIILIPTSNRPQLLLRLLKQIKKQFTCQYKLKIYNDCSDSDYSYVQKYLKQNFKNYYYKKLQIKHGKIYFWKLHNLMYQQMKYQDYDYLIQLFDDMELIENFYPSIVNRFQSCKKVVNCGVLSIGISQGIHMTAIKKRIKKIKIGDHYYWEMQWNDGCFITDSNYLKDLKYNCGKYNSIKYNTVSSGSHVGNTVSKKYTKLGGKILVVCNSMIIHHGKFSEMRQLERGSEFNMHIGEN